MEFQDFVKKVFFQLLSLPHQKFLKRLSMVEETVFGILQVVMIYAGIEATIALIRVVLLAWERIFDFNA